MMDEVIIYSNSRHGLGIRILGSRKMTGQQGIYVKELLSGGLAEQDGRLKVGDQILSINNQSVVGVDREGALRILRSAALTNEVCLHVRHIHSNSSSMYYQKVFADHEFSSPNNHRRQLEDSNEKSSYVSSVSGRRDEDEDQRIDRLSKQLNINPIVLNCLLRSSYQCNDLIDLVKCNSHVSLLDDPIKEFHLSHQLSQTHSDGRITMEDFEYEFNLIFSEDLDILRVFYASTLNSLSTKNGIDDHHLYSVREIRQEIFKYQARIAELEKEIVMCEKAQSLAKQIENEYEHILQNLADQIQQYHFNGEIYAREAKMKEEFLKRLVTHVSDYRYSSEQLVS